MRTRKYRFFSCDFETTVYDGQESTEVWASACVELFSEDVKILHSIDETFDYFKSLKSNIIAYYHNLKFDGSFWLSYLITEKHFAQAYTPIGDKDTDIEWKHEKDMLSNTFKYSISEQGQWYSIIIRVGKYFIEIRDSLKLLPFSVKRIGESFGTKHKKLEMEYKGFRYAGCEITEEEKKYIANDVLVVKEALEIMFSEGHKKLTIGSCCLDEYKRICKKSVKNALSYDEMFPDLYAIDIDKDVYKYPTAGDYVRRSYKGGWCYLVKGKENRIFHNGTTADVNSLYPSMMSSESGNYYPVSIPHFWTGNYIPDEAKIGNRYYFVRIKTRFYIKENMLPFIQIKNTLLYKGTEALESSDVYDKSTGKYYTHYTDENGNLQDTRRELVLTMTDFQLMQEHYYLVDFEILDGCWFYAEKGIFDEYIEKYKKIKLESKGAKRELAKLFLNNLYGKMASSTDSSFKLAYEKEDGSIGFLLVPEANKTPGYIACGSAITSYARNFTIRAAQANFYGVDKPGFTYADTDSIHCDLPADKITGIKVHDKNFCCWKLESGWDYGWFVRQKTYIEHIVSEDGEKIDSPFYNVKCAGMPKRSKDLFIKSMTGEGNLGELTPEESEFIKVKRGLTDFKIGLRVPGKLLPRQIKGGVVLTPTSYEMR